jgi:hypothetical protein
LSSIILKSYGETQEGTKYRHVVGEWRWWGQPDQHTKTDLYGRSLSCLLAKKFSDKDGTMNKSFGVERLSEMVSWLWQRFLRRYAWLRPTHPIFKRERQAAPPLPTTLVRFNNIWAVLSYAALMHALIFIFALMSYNMSAAAIGGHGFSSLVTPFMTPFGTPVLVSVLHSLLYWALLLGACHYATHAMAREKQRNTLTLLQLTATPVSHVVFAKAVAVFTQWWPVLKVLFIVRLLIGLILPLSVLSPLAREAQDLSGFMFNHALSLGVFLLQPYVETLACIGLGLLAGATAANPLQARLAAIAGATLTIGGFNMLVGLWYTFASPVGLAGMVLGFPLGHWGALVGGVVPPQGGDIGYMMQSVLMVLCYVILPAALGLWLIKRTVKYASAV